MCPGRRTPRYIGKGHNRCFYTSAGEGVADTVLFCHSTKYIFCYNFSSSQASMEVIVKLNLESCSCRILLRKIHFQICIEQYKAEIQNRWVVTCEFTDIYGDSFGRKTDET